jgi:hypothetical protein
MTAEVFATLSVLVPIVLKHHADDDGVFRLPHFVYQPMPYVYSPAICIFSQKKLFEGRGCLKGIAANDIDEVPSLAIQPACFHLDGILLCPFGV